MRSGVWRVSLRAWFIEWALATLALLFIVLLFLLLLLVLSSSFFSKIYSYSYSDSMNSYLPTRPAHIIYINDIFLCTIDISDQWQHVPSVIVEHSMWPIYTFSPLTFAGWQQREYTFFNHFWTWNLWVLLHCNLVKGPRGPSSSGPRFSGRRISGESWVWKDLELGFQGQ